MIRAKAATLPDIDLNPRREPALDFPDRAFGELQPADYAELGFLCGLEVHQQLHTSRKLFCRCPAGIRTTRVDAELLRHMRPTLSEMGEYDGCALMEFKTRKEIVYLLERSTVCTYEMDDTPPFPIDEQAVRQALEVSMLFGLDLVSELQVMRKQYLDGSIPTGFQRTAMIGVGGVIPFRSSELGRGRELRIRQLTLEEDSCREVSDVGHRITFRTDRLGMPLVETVTEPDLLTPRDVAAGGRLLAEVARASGKVRRGAGAARQDVNVSIAGSRRVELKGVPSHRWLPRLVHNEAYRHLNLLRLRAELRRRALDAAALALPDDGWPWEACDHVADVSRTLANVELAPGDTLCAVKLAGFGGLLAHATQPGRTFADELFERVRVIACPTSMPFALCSDLHEQVLGATIWRQLRAAVRATGDDAVVLVWGPPRDAATAAREVLARAAEAFVGVPSETRMARADGSTGFERILPGPQRMYPDTDTPPLPIPDGWVNDIAARLARQPWERADGYRSRGISEAAAARLAVAPWADLFDALAPGRRSAARVAAAFERRLPWYWRQSGTRTLPDVERLRPWVAALDDGSLPLCACDAAFNRLLREDATPAAILADHRTDDRDLPRAVAHAVAAARALADGAALRFAMGAVLRAVPRGRFDPTTVRERLAAALTETER